MTILTFFPFPFFQIFFNEPESPDHYLNYAYLIIPYHIRFHFRDIYSCSIETFDSFLESHNQRKNNKNKYARYFLQGLSKLLTILQQNIFLTSNH